MSTDCYDIMTGCYVQIELLGPPCLLGESCLLAAELPQLNFRPATLR
jgi:hypothetical protein